MRKQKKILLFFVLLSLWVVCLSWTTKNYGQELWTWEGASQIVRRWFIGSNFQLNKGLNCLYWLFEKLYNLFYFLDDAVFFFPSWLKIVLWTEKVISFFLLLPLVTISSVVIISLKNRTGKIIVFFLTLLAVIPVSFFFSRGWNGFITKTGINIKTPISKQFSWIWNEKEEEGYTLFVYQWQQKAPTEKAIIKISCLDHYRLRVNGEDVYDGPSFAVPPTVYYDQINIAPLIKSGENKIEIIARFLKVPLHERADYSEPGLMIGGEIKNGLFYQNLADWRFWKTKKLPIEWGKRISANAGFATRADWTQTNLKLLPVVKISRDYEPKLRPLPLLEYEKITPPATTNSVYDLGRFMPGYLEIESELKGDCLVKVVWAAELDHKQTPVPYFEQIDEYKLPKGTYKFRGLERRAGRFIGIEKDDCEGGIEIGFWKVGAKFDMPSFPETENELDRKIINLCQNTLKNNLQDHFEDCLEREKAMYIGDAFEVSRCLIKDGKNSDLVKEMLNLFSQSQKQDGMIPSMTPSGNEQYIPGYALQWIIWLEEYASKTKDFAFSKEKEIIWKKVLSWAENNQSEDGFIYNKTGKDHWWNFISWTKTDDRYPFSTPLQIWYWKALESASFLIGEDENQYHQKAEKLRQDIYQKAFNKKTGVFSDSFSSDDKSTASLVTNALAGRLGFFKTIDESTKALDYFKNKQPLFTQSPYSQSWVVDWVIKAGDKKTAVDLIRKYWGGMLKQGYTSLPEVYSPTGSPILNGSQSHAWGCGPIYLYDKVLN